MRKLTHLDEEHERFIVTFSEGVAMEDVREMALLSEKAGILKYTLLVDASDARIDGLDADLTQFQQLLCELARSSRIGRTAVHVASEADLKIVSNLAVAGRDWCEIHAFLDRPEAETWLGWQPRHDSPA